MDTVHWTVLTEWLVGFLVTLAAYWFWNARRRYSVLQRKGLRGPTPSLFTGNTAEILQKGFHQAYKDWENKYGKVFGVYRAHLPTMVVGDLDLVRQVMVTDFQSFCNRRTNLVLNYKPYNLTLVLLRDNHWKHVRSKLSPIFSSAKLKQMLPILQHCCKNLLTHVTQKAENGQKVDTRVLSGAFCMDATASTAFGMEVDSLSNPQHPFVKCADKIVDPPPPWMAKIIFSFPKLTPYLRHVGISLTPRDATQYLLDVVAAALKHRRQEKQSYSDVLQFLLDAQMDPKDQVIDPEIDHSKELNTKSAWKNKGLTEEEIQANALDVLMASFDTTAAAMSFLLYNLAAHPHCVKRVQREIDVVVGQWDAVDYEMLNQMTYMDMFINESQRLYPVAFAIDRECCQDTEVGGVQVTKGMLVTVPVYNIHTDPENWPDPYTFDPERHTPEARASRHPFSFLPFGMGPRNCIGMRMAQMELKLTLATILWRFTPVLCNDSIYPPRPAKHFRLIADHEMWIKFEARKE